MNKRNKKRDLTALGLAIIILIMLNFLGSFVFHRFDLTTEKRFTLSPVTKTLLSKLNDVVYVKVYLDGDFPARFKNLRNETKEILNEFRIYSNDNIEYEFINPSENPDKNQQEEVYKQLFKKGIIPTTADDNLENGVSQQVIWPGAIVSYKGKEIAWNFLKTQSGQNEAQLNNSIQSLEYEFASCIRNLSTPIRPIIGFIEGQGELDTLSVKSITEALSEFYITKRIQINERLNALDEFKAIIIAKPDTSFSEKDKFIIDQFVMKGGKILWTIDPLKTAVDSLAKTGNTISDPLDLKLDDMFFKYGVRINTNMVLDIQCSGIAVNKAMRGQQPRFEPLPWIFYPLISPAAKHPITKNLELIKIEFGASIDTVGSKDITKTILLQSSKYSKTLQAPVRVDMNYLRYQPDETQFQNSFQPIAVLLEGEFESVFKNRIAPQIANDSAIGYKANGVKNKMIVIADGDVIRNDVQFSSKKALPLGYDRNTNRTYGNKNFILNCMNYLCDDSGLISVRARELTLRLLDKKKTKNNRLYWQIFNTIFPLFVILLFGIIHNIVRKRKYAK